MSYDVIVSLEAVEDVLRITMARPTKAPIIAAVKQMQDALKLEPKTTGQHLSEGLYFVDREPLRAFFIVDDDKATVEIINVRTL